MAAKKTMLTSLRAETQPRISCVPSILDTMRRRTRSGSAPCSSRSAQVRGSAGQSVPRKVGGTRATVLLWFSGSGLLEDVIWLSWRTRTVLLQLLSLVLALALVCSCGKPVQGPTVTVSHFWKKKTPEQLASYCWFNSLNSGVCQVPGLTHGRGWEPVAKG